MSRGLRLRIEDLPPRARAQVQGKLAPKAEPKANKFGAQKAMVGDEKLDSKREARAYQGLLMRQAAGEIAGLRRQVSYDLCVNGVFIGRYVADFVYETPRGEVVADAKGVRTPVYVIKRKLMRAIHGIEIQEM